MMNGLVWSADAAPKSAKSKPSDQVKLLNINTATLEQLQTLPDISEAEAAKIVASRPFGSKAWLVTQGILSAEKYQTIKQLIVAEQPFKSAAKNEAMYNAKSQKAKPVN
jgi:DNA uptake protein ComE-like DNA-binding protein